MMKKMKRAFLLLVVLLFVLPPKGIEAHPEETCRAGGEEIGWKIGCGGGYGHIGPHERRMAYDMSKLPAEYQSIVVEGAKRWNDTGIVDFREAAVGQKSTGTMDVYNDEETSVIAAVWVQINYEDHFNRYGNYRTNHIKSWEMKFNLAQTTHRSFEENAAVAAHEFGHTIGLHDLYEKHNSEKLMYGYMTPAQHSPTKKDIEGALEAVK